MKKTYVTTMPDHAGAFLKASQCMASLGVNITRISYNKAVDTHTLFIEAEGTEAQLAQATEHLEAIGYLQSGQAPSVILVEFRLPDRPGSITSVLELIERFRINISYMSSRESGDGWQLIKMGLLIEKPEEFFYFFSDASQLCHVRVIDYDRAEKILDNSVFYTSFASALAERMALPPESQDQLIVQSNLVMHMLDERNEPFHRIFNNIEDFTEVLARNRGEAFAPRVTEFDLSPQLHIILIEPPCGSNTTILCHRGMYLFIDTGYACYREEMLSLLRQLIPDFDTCRKAALITHADLDHCGLLDLFPTVYMSRKSKDSLVMEYETGVDFRERNPLHAPYIRISKTLTSYRRIVPSTMQVICGDPEPVSEPLQAVGKWSFGDLEFDLYEGAGGHLAGEIVLVERKHRLVFSGDILINVKDQIPEQIVHNRFAPYLMTSVDTTPALCTAERKALPGLLTPGTWRIFGGHGACRIMEI